ncbi:MAG: glycerophosphodiester phosphodiesterase, partial [Spirosomataceae bacterium]
MQSIIRSLVFLIFIGTTGCITQKSKTNLTPIADFLRYDTQKPALISVHRGGGEEKNIPENGIESFT